MKKGESIINCATTKCCKEKCSLRPIYGCEADFFGQTVVVAVPSNGDYIHAEMLGNYRFGAQQLS